MRKADCYVIGIVKFRYPHNVSIYFALNAPPIKGRRKTPTPIKEKSTTKMPITTNAAIIYLIIFFMIAIYLI